MHKLASATIGVLILSTAGAFSQLITRPDPTPRLPPQAGQGIPVEDRQFISRAANLSEAEMEAGRLAFEKGNSPAIKEFGQRLVSEYEKLNQAVQELAKSNAVQVEPHPSKAQWQQELQRLGTLQAQGFDREFMKWQLQVHLALVKLYQTEASQSPETDLAKFAITSLTRIQRIFDQAKKLGSDLGASIDTVQAPPQY
jgi:predicted outer membrane protein